MSRARQVATIEQAEGLFTECPMGGQSLHRIHELVSAWGPCDLVVSRTQVAWARRRSFAVLWRPDLWLKHPEADAVLGIALPHEDDSPRWKQVAMPRPGLFMHHLELTSVDNIDAPIIKALHEAFDAAGPRPTKP